jgi:hypothetical protein
MERSKSLAVQVFPLASHDESHGHCTLSPRAVDSSHTGIPYRPIHPQFQEEDYARGIVELVDAGELRFEGVEEFDR